MLVICYTMNNELLQIGIIKCISTKIATRVVCVNVKLPQSAKIRLWTALEHSIINSFI